MTTTDDAPATREPVILQLPPGALPQPYVAREFKDAGESLLRFQIGVIETEFRFIEPRNFIPDGFSGHVTLFRLVGYGPSLELAKKNARLVNGTEPGRKALEALIG